MVVLSYEIIISNLFVEWKEESLWESENRRMDQVLLHGVGRAGLPWVCLGGLSSPGRFMSPPLKMKGQLRCSSNGSKLLDLSGGNTEFPICCGEKHPQISADCSRG